MRRSLAPLLRWAGRARYAVEMAVHVLLTVGLVYSWLSSVSTVIRPAFVWSGGQPPAAATDRMEDATVALLLVAGGAALIRFLVQLRATRRPSVVLRRAVKEPLSIEERLRLRRYRWSGWMGLLGRSLLATLLLSGLFSSVAHFVIVAVGMTAILAGRRLLGQADRWAKLMFSIPLPIRLAGGAALTVVVANIFLAPRFGRAAAIAPVLIVSLTGVLILSLLLPEDAGAVRGPHARTLTGVMLKSEQPATR
jgi:hypothetical protein